MPVKHSQALQFKNYFTVKRPQAFLDILSYRKTYFTGLHTRTDTRHCYTNLYLAGALKISIISFLNFFSSSVYFNTLFSPSELATETIKELLNSTLFNNPYTVAIV